MDKWEILLKHYGVDEIIENGDSWRLNCPIHGSDNPSTFVINTSNKLWYCHSTCGEGGDMITFVRRMESLSFKNAKMKLEWILDSEVNTHSNKTNIRRDAELFIKSTKETDREIIEYIPPSNTIPIKSFRGFGEATLRHFNVGYNKSYPITTKSGRNMSVGEKLVFPITYNGMVVGASLRRIDKNSVKWFHVPHGLHVGSILYNYDGLTPSEPVYVVEGITDVLKLHSIGITNTVCTFGANITNQQERLLLNIAETIIMCYDGDEAGYKGMEKAYERLRNKVNFFYIDLEGGDPCDKEDEELLILLNNRRRWK